MIFEFAMDPVVQFALHAAAALLFLVSAAHKLRDPFEFRSALEAYDVIPAAALMPVGVAFVAAEAAVGIGFVFPTTGLYAGVAGAGLMLLYGVAMVVNLARGRAFIDCGCGGLGGRRPLSRGLVLRNALLAGGLLLAALPIHARPTTWLDAITACSLLASLSLLYAALDVALANAAKLRLVGGAPWNTG